MTAWAGPVYFDPYTVEIWSDPYPVYRRMREEVPLYYNERYDFYACSRFEDVERGLLDHETFSSARGDVLELIKANVRAPRGLMIMEDPPLHTVNREVLSRIFTPRNMSRLEIRIREFCARSLDPLIGAGRFDFIADLGARMPARIIGMLLGIPGRDLQPPGQATDARIRTLKGMPMTFSQEDLGGEDFADYVEWRARNPCDDAMTQLLTAEFRDETGTTRRLRREELLAMVNMMAVAGSETTRCLIGWTGKLLAEHPEQRREIAGNPGLIPQAIEEILRFESPGPHAARHVTREVEIHGVKLPKGSAIDFLIGSANRDERRFADGDRFDIRRQRHSHMAFGHGIHSCLGAALARLQGRIALEEILKRFPDWEVDYDKAELSSATAVRGWETMPTFIRAGVHKAQRRNTEKQS